MSGLTQVDGVLSVEDSGVAHSLPAADASASGRFLTLEEQTLLAQARRGNKRALRDFYDAYQGQVRAHLYRLLGRDHEIDDVMQIVFARAFAALHTFKGNSTVSTWLYRITANTTHNILRQRFRRDRLKSAFQWFNLSRDAHLHNGQLDARDQAQRILQRLRPDLREVFVLYHYEGLTLQEISDVLGKPVSTLGHRLTRGRAP